MFMTSYLLAGYRQIPLFDKYGDSYSQALLLVHIVFPDAWRSEVRFKWIDSSCVITLFVGEEMMLRIWQPCTSIRSNGLESLFTWNRVWRCSWLEQDKQRKAWILPQIRITVMLVTNQSHCNACGSVLIRLMHLGGELSVIVLATKRCTCRNGNCKQSPIYKIFWILYYVNNIHKSVYIHNIWFCNHTRCFNIDHFLFSLWLIIIFVIHYVLEMFWNSKKCQDNSDETLNWGLLWTIVRVLSRMVENTH